MTGETSSFCGTLSRGFAGLRGELPGRRSDEHHFHSLPPEEAHALMLARNARRKPPPHPEPIEFEEFTAKEVKCARGPARHSRHPQTT